MAVVGLREQKKAETREAISLAAVRLTAEHGLDSVTGDAIAEAARVAPRTFRNYFANKEEAILHAVNVFVAHFAAEFTARDRDEPVLQSLETAAVAVFESPHEVDKMLMVGSITRENAPLRVHWAAIHAHLDLTAITDEVARRTKTNPRTDVYPRVVTQAAWGVITSAFDMQAGPKGNIAKLTERVRIGFASLAQGLSAPIIG